MRDTATVLIAFLTGGLLLGDASPTRAVPVSTYAQWSTPQQRAFNVQLIDGVLSLLESSGDRQAADKYARLFNLADAQPDSGTGIQEYLDALPGFLQMARAVQSQGGEPMHVEYALGVVIEKYGIKVAPAALLSVMQGFPGRAQRNPSPLERKREQLTELGLMAYELAARQAEPPAEPKPTPKAPAKLFANAIILHDGRHVIFDADTNSWLVINRDLTDGPTLTGADKAEAERLADCLARGYSNCK
jgi:hypothetical protein